MKKTEFSKIVLLIIAATAILMCFTACSSSAQKTEIVSVRLDVREKSGTVTSKLVIEGTVADTFAKRNKGNIYLFRVTPDNAEKALLTLDGIEPIGQRKIKSGKIEFTVPLSGRGDIGLASSYLLASLGDDGKYTALTSPEYVVNPEAYASRTDEYPKSYSVKGLSSDSSDVSEMIRAGVRHTTVTVMASDIESADGQIIEYSNAGIAVFLRIIPDLSSGDALYAAFLAAAERYAGSAGRVSAFIVGDRLNEDEDFEDEQEYLFKTEKTARLAFTALRSVYSCGRMYISLGDGWESGKISSRRFISLYDTFAKAGGDYDWGVAFRAGLDIPLGASVPTATKIALDNRKIPFGDFDDIIDFMSGTTYKYHAESTRHIMIDGGEITVNGSDSESTQSRAAALVEGLTYAQDKSLDAFIYSGNIHADGNIYAAFVNADIEGACSEDGRLSYVRGMLGDKFSAVYSKLCGTSFSRDVSSGSVFTPDYVKNGYTVSPIADFNGEISEKIVSLYSKDEFTQVLTKDFSPASPTDENSEAVENFSILIKSEDGSPVGIHIRDVQSKSLRGKNVLSVYLRALGEKQCHTSVYIEEKSTHNSYYASTLARVNTYGSVSFDASEFFDSLDSASSVDITLIFSADGETSFGIDSVNAVKIVGKFSGNFGFILTVVILILILLTLIVEIIRQLFKSKPKHSEFKDENGR